MNLIERLKELDAKATPGPWDAEHRYVGCKKNENRIDKLQEGVNCGLGGYIIQSPDPDRGQLNAMDLAFIVEMRNALPKLLAFVKAYDWWLELFMEDAREDLPDDGSLELAVKCLDETRKALEEP